MHRHFDNRLKHTVIIIHPGEYLATDEDVIISTVLGSCVAVALHDPQLGIGGLNHFMLPGEISGRDFFREDSGRYGMYAMELLINALLKQGARKQRLVAKVFGGGHVLHATGSANIPDSNVRFALEFLATEELRIESRDLGGNQARKILFYPKTNRVLLKRFGGQSVAPVEQEEFQYLKQLRQRSTKPAQTEVTFF